MSRRERIYRFFLHNGCLPQDAEDLTQHVCLRLCQAGSPPEDAPDNHWKHLCRLILRDHLRQRYRERDLFVPLDTLSDCPAPTQGLCENEGAFLQECLLVLSGKQRQVIQMHFEEEMSFAEIAEAMGCTRSAVCKLYHRAIARLRKHFHVPDKRGVLQSERSPMIFPKLREKMSTFAGCASNIYLEQVLMSGVAVQMAYGAPDNIRRTRNGRLQILTAVFAGLLCVFIWMVPENPYWLTGIKRYFEEKRRVRAVEQLIAKLRNDPVPGMLVQLPSGKDVLNRDLPKTACWVLVISAVSSCSIAPLREWQQFAQQREEPFIVITTSSIPVVRLFAKEHGFSDMYFISDPLIAERAGWNVFMYPRLYLLDQNRKLLWVCQMPMAHRSAIPDHIGGQAP